MAEKNVMEFAGCIEEKQTEAEKVAVELIHLLAGRGYSFEESLDIAVELKDMLEDELVDC